MTDGRPLLLIGAVLSPVDAGRAVVHEAGYVAVRDGVVEAVGSLPPGSRGPDGWRRLAERSGSGEVDPALQRALDASPRIVDVGRALILPAFVDAHVHLPQIDVRGRYGAPLLEWLERWVYPAEAALADPDRAAAVAARFFAAMAAAGVGSAGVFATVHRQATHRAFEVAEESGLRVVMGKVLMDRGAPKALLEPVDRGITDSLALAERWEGAAGGRLRYAITPRFALSCSAEMLAAAGRAAVEAGLRVQTHLAEQPDEVDAVAAAFPDAADYLDVYARAGLVKPGAVFAHAIHCSDDAYRRLAAGGGAIACCPTSNAFLGSGAFPLARARAAGVTIGVGSDVGAGPQFSPLDVLRHLAHLDRLTGEEILYRGTAAGAEALALDDVTGRLEPGRAADLVVLAPPADVEGDPLQRFVQSVFRQPEMEIVATLVEGRVVHGELPG